MTFSRNHLATRQRIAFEAVLLPSGHSLAACELLEKEGNWFLAGESYGALDASLVASASPESRAKLLARAACCFEISSMPHSAARAYSDAARLLSQNNLRAQDSAELYNRSALQFSKVKEFFNAGSSWRSAAAEFQKLGNAIVYSTDNIGPMPGSAAGLTCAGICFNAAGFVFESAAGNEMWACGAYWEAARCLSVAYPNPNIQTCDAYRSAFIACIRYYGGLDLDLLRNSFPLTQQERDEKLDPLKVFEESIFRCSFHHQPNISVAKRNAAADRETNRYLAAAYHMFSLELLKIGNSREAGIYRRREKDRWRLVYSADRHFGKAALYAFWNITSGYGESLARWIFTCAFVLGVFSFLYFYFNAIEPVSSNIDYVYFSVITFTSLGYGDIHPEGVIGKILASAEIVLGLIMFGVLLSFLGNRFQRT